MIEEPEELLAVLLLGVLGIVGLMVLLWLKRMIEHAVGARPKKRD